MTIDEANVRLRLGKGDSLCLNEHTINQDDNPTHGNRRLWLTCGGETIAEAVWSDQMLAEDKHWPWITQQVERHRAVVAERLVAELLGQEQLVDLVALLWSEIPLSAEAKVVARMREEGVYEAWEDAMNANPSAIVGTPEKWAADWGEGSRD